jgi:hypothetical protein
MPVANFDLAKDALADRITAAGQRFILACRMRPPFELIECWPRATVLGPIPGYWLSVVKKLSNIHGAPITAGFPVIRFFCKPYPCIFAGRGWHAVQILTVRVCGYRTIRSPGR